MPMPSAKIPDNHKEVLDTIRRLEASRIETPHAKGVCCASDLLVNAVRNINLTFINISNAMSREQRCLLDAIKKSSNKKKIVEIAYSDISKMKKETDKQEKLLTQAELAHKKATTKLVAEFSGQSTHLKSMLKDTKGDQVAQIKGLIANTQASIGKIGQGSTDVMVNGKAYRDQIQGDRKSGEKLLKKTEKLLEDLKKKLKSKKK